MRSDLDPNVYQPLFVGASSLSTSDRTKIWEYDDRDSDNISSKNKTFCELTGLYHIWRHDDNDVVGLCHYRRYLAQQRKSNIEVVCPLSSEEITELLSEHDCLVARKENLVYYLQPISVAYHYRVSHCSTDLQILKLVIKRYYPDYLSAFNHVAYSYSFFPCNIIICRKNLLDQYAAWLFDVLGHLELLIDPFTDRNPYQQRVFGFLAERLLNIFLEKNCIDAYECELIDGSGRAIPRCTFNDIAPYSFRDPSKRWEPILNTINYSRVFSLEFYLTHYRDVALAFGDNPKSCLEHYLVHGIQEGRTAHPHFSIDSYINGNPQLRNRFEGNKRAVLEYYLKHPWSNRHVIGYENLFKGDEHREIRQGELLSVSIAMIRKYLFHKKAESLPVID